MAPSSRLPSPSRTTAVARPTHLLSSPSGVTISSHDMQNPNVQDSVRRRTRAPCRRRLLEALVGAAKHGCACVRIPHFPNMCVNVTTCDEWQGSAEGQQGWCSMGWLAHLLWMNLTRPAPGPNQGWTLGRTFGHFGTFG